MINPESAKPAIIEIVFDEPTYLPDDPLYTSGSQWYLYDTSSVVASLNISVIWDDYTGNGVTVGIVDDGVEYDHEDLAANANLAMGRNFVSHQLTTPNDGRPYDNGDRHGTTVAGILAGADNNTGVVGVAFEASISALRIGFNSDHSTTQVQAAFIEAKNFDIINNSWGYGGYFYDNFNDADSFGGSANPFIDVNNALIDAVSNGRPHETDASINLGTIFVVAAGNEKVTAGSNLPDQNVNYHGFTSSPYTIAVGGYVQNGTDASFSTPGAAVLLAGPASGVKTTDLTGGGGYNTSGDYVSKSGTSYAAPAVAGVAALMLEANPNLGFRDVQEIFVLSSQFGDPNDTDWMINGAGDWNGGGKHVSDELGFGTLDAFNAVRLAETWEKLGTYATMAEATVSSGAIGAALDRNTVTHTITVADQGIDLDQVVLNLNMSHTRIGEVTVTLTSPEGTTSLLINKPGGGAAFASTFIDEYQLTSVQYWGEQIAGDWTLTVTDKDYNTVDGIQNTGTLNSYSLTFLGDAASDDDLYVYTSEYKTFGTQASRQVLSDAGGIDTLNLATIQDDLVIDLTPGAVNTLRTNPLTIAAGTVIENIYGGDGADTFTGNAADNVLHGMRGNDDLSGAGGNDIIDGGAGYDTATYLGNIGGFSITLNADGTVTVEDIAGSEGRDTLIDVELVQFADGTYQVGDPIVPPIDPGKPLIVLPVITHTGTASGSEYIKGDAGDNVLATGGGTWDLLDGGAGDDTYIIYNPSVSIRDSSFGGNDTLYSGAYSYNLPNFIENGIMLETAVILNGGFLDNYLEGNDLANSIKGNDGDDRIAAWGGDDFIEGGEHNDVIDGGAGIDTANFAGNLADFLITEQADGSVTVLDLVGALGVDRLTHVEFLQFADQTIATPNAIADPADGMALAPLSHPSGYIVPTLTISGTADNYEVVDGTNGNDVIWGGGGHSDVLRASLGDDVYIITHAGTSIREYTGSGEDTLVTYASSFSTNESFETIYMMYGAISFSGTFGDNSIYGNDHTNIISAGDGNDIVFGYAGDDVLDGGDGDDDLSGGEGNDEINGGAGFDDVATYSGAKADYVIVENPDDSITVTAIVGNDGMDTLTGIETIVFSDGIYLPGIVVPPGPVDPIGGKPPVVLPVETHTGTGAGSERLTGDSGDNVLNGGGGNWDLLSGEGGNDSYIVLTNAPIVLQEGTSGGTDTIYTDASVTYMSLHFEIAYLLDNADNISGTAFSNYIEGNDKANAIYGLDDTDELVGWGGDDILVGGAGNDFINGGDGTGDTAVFVANLANYLIEEQGDGSVTVLDLVGDEGTDRVIGVEFLQFADQTIATPGPDIIGLNAGPLSALPGPNNILPPGETISGTLEGYEKINGTNGDDVLASGGGYLDTLTGGDGDDSYIIEGDSTRIQEFYNGGNDTVYTYASAFTTSAQIETFYMMYGALSLNASGHDNTVYGNKHDNTINGRNGNDTISGAEGNDTLNGGGGTDIAVFQGDLADFDITYLGGTTLEVSDIAGGGQGIDTVTGFEFLQFNDQLVDSLSFYV